MILLVSLILLCGFWSVVAAVLIVADLRKRGMNVNVFSMRLMIFKYLSDYIRITRAQTGRVGLLFYHYIVPLNLALIMFIALVFVA